MREIVLTTDFSELAREAYPVAAALAKDLDARLHLVHEVPPPSPAHFEYLNVEIGSELYREPLEQEAKHSAFEGLEVQTSCISLADEIPHLLEFIAKNKPALVVVASHGRSGFSHLFLGSFAEKLVRYSQSPVYVHHTGERVFPPKNVLVPFDFSDAAKTVIGPMRELSRLYRPRFRFAYVLDAPIYYVPDLYLTNKLEEERSSITSSARKEFQELADDQFPEVDAEFVVLNGAPGPEILSLAKRQDCDLILLATHGQTGIKRLLLGSVAEKIARQAPCSVMTVLAHED